MKCIHCGCTEDHPCEGGCSWVLTDPPVCSRCDEAGVPLYKESIGGALIDSARISVMAAAGMIPRSQIIVPDAIVAGDTASVHNCLEEAMSWLDAARALTIEHGAQPPTSIHVVPR